MTCDLSPHHLPPYSLPLLPSCCLRKQASSHAFSLFPLLTSYCDHLHHSAVLSVTPFGLPLKCERHLPHLPPRFGFVGVGGHPGTQMTWALISVGT